MPPSSRRRVPEQPDPLTSRSQRTQNPQGGSSAIAAAASAAPTSAAQASAPKPKSPGRAMPEPLYSTTTKPDMDQLSALVPALSLDDILSGKPLPLDLSTGVPGNDFPAIGDFGTVVGPGSGDALLSADRHNRSGLTRRALRPWERAASPSASSGPPPPPRPTPAVAAIEGVPAVAAPSPTAAAPHDGLQAARTPAAASAASDARDHKGFVGARRGPYPEALWPPSSSADHVRPTSPSSSAKPTVSHADIGASSAVISSRAPTSMLSPNPTRQPAPGPAGSGFKVDQLAGQRTPSATASAPPSPSDMSSSHGSTPSPFFPTAPSTAPSSARPSVQAVTPTTATELVGHLAAGAPQPALLPRPVNRQRRGPRQLAVPPDPQAAALSEAPSSSLTVGADAGGHGGLVAEVEWSALGANLLEFAGAAPLGLIFAVRADATMAQPATGEVLRSTRAPRAERVRSKEWMAAAQAVETHVAGAGLAGTAGNGSTGGSVAWEAQLAPSASAGVGHLGFDNSGVPGVAQRNEGLVSGHVFEPWRRHSTVVSRDQGPWRRHGGDGGHGMGAAAAGSGVMMPGMNMEPRGVLVLHEEPLRDALDAAMAAAFPLPSREQLPEVVDRNNWRLHAAVLFPALYDADWHSCLFDFFFELWPEVGRAHVTAGGPGSSRRLLLTSEVEVAEALAAEAAGAATGPKVQPSPPPARVQLAARLLDDAYAFAARCFASVDFAVRSSVVISALDCMDDHDALLEHMAARLPPLMVQRLMVPLASRFQPPWVVQELLAAVVESHPGYAPVASVPRRWRELMGQLAAAEVVHPGGGLGVVLTALEFEEVQQPGEVQQRQVSAHPKDTEARLQEAAASQDRTPPPPRR
ncbi:hypothetical protein VOLCADRAFT_104673 [Volvox carteri f. nagariensis]|uniref:Uncharacterized protein n=1 Tax=Volvox carteri f. nagariensis TaxID=3068 RepID=D8TVN8_VOLCA|nr:uncharacterized protein VOLCADRAFT_104673 [Volvox carteri f. nagariensis]EFJ48486.1 hypothetical protein VOLCADRAFT_104673 [Volvox carteri f. nagariensis]|eukprot:XP_002950285.1 hypothetical protein VOLCADRAFT_104673 [Volvox carteri f. nagariensis]